MKNKNARISLGLRIVLMSILMVLFAHGIFAEERFNERIVEAYKQMSGTVEFHFAGVDQNGDGFSDLFIVIPYTNSLPLATRLASLLREGATVSYDDKGKFSDGTLNQTALLEINGRSVLQIFPDKRADFPAEVARQSRLSTQAPAQPQSAEERRIADLEAELQRLKQGR